MSVPTGLCACGCVGWVMRVCVSVMLRAHAYGHGRKTHAARARRPAPWRAIRPRCHVGFTQQACLRMSPVRVCVCVVCVCVSVVCVCACVCVSHSTVCAVQPVRRPPPSEYLYNLFIYIYVSVSNIDRGESMPPSPRGSIHLHLACFAVHTDSLPLRCWLQRRSSSVCRRRL